MPITFKEATDRLFGRVTADDLAAEMGVARNTIARARMDPSSPNFRPPPHGWQAAVAKLAERQTGDMGELVKALT